ncbi:iron-containing redox enzyme family protein [Haliangium ochraceum]|uniref:Iron-containing redox enzyme family protein n=1 Tax=Haliangium ochraceum (strain DSM 14365 / JCM 11303 / SMP-2) TaxID=502025 RepID=D0LTF0_HALO1|nr:iron-containing redox enzyme family protein [Haliangium ochraceum]ACY13845.1 hypothetical protein Hoch_1287 [Haliangium ochraceum DSM 14365]
MLTPRPSLSSAIEFDIAEVAALHRECLLDPSTEPSLDQRRRARSAQRLAHAAFELGDRRAWETAQAVIWQLMRRESFRLVHPSDTEVIDILFRAEAASISLPVPPEELTLDEFCDVLDRDLAAALSQERFVEEQLEPLGAEDWCFLLSNFVPSGWDFARVIALTAAMLPLDLAIPLYENLYDEGGRGGQQVPHRVLFGRMLQALGAKEHDLDGQPLAAQGFLDRVVPEAIAELNTWCRMLWSRHPGGAIGALYSVEVSVPSYFAPLERLLRRQGLDDEALEYITGHQETDVEHAGQWRVLLQRYLERRPEERTAVYQGALLSANSDVLAWQSAVAALADWRAGRSFANIGEALRRGNVRTPDRVMSENPIEGYPAQAR